MKQGRSSSAIGLGIAAAALLGYFWMSWQSGDGAPSDDRSLLSKIASPSPETVTVPAGTRIYVRLQEAISTERNSSGDSFKASLNGPLILDSKVVAPSRSKLLGRLTEVKESGRVKGRARLTMVLRKLIVNGKEYELVTKPVTQVAPGTTTKDAIAIAGSAIAGGPIGASIGVATSAAYVLATKGEPVAYGPEARFTFTLAQPMELPVVRKMGGSEDRGGS